LRDCLRRILGCVRGSSGGCCATLIGSGELLLLHLVPQLLLLLEAEGPGYQRLRPLRLRGRQLLGCQRPRSEGAQRESRLNCPRSFQRLEMFGKLLMMATALSVTFTAAQAAAGERSDCDFGPKNSAGSQRERLRAMRCELLGSLVCSAVSFVRESGLCLLSAVRNASFGAAGGSSQVFSAHCRRAGAVRCWRPGVPLDTAASHRGNLSFARNWTEYENGFGDGYDFWIGLRIINELTGNSPRLLRVERLSPWSNVLYVCEYSNFTVGNSTTNYTMNYGSYLTASSNTSMDSLNYHRGRPFTTIDRDNDQNPSGACTDTRGFAGWWYANCCNANPNGMYFHSAVTDMSAMVWFGATSSSYIALKSIRLMLYLA
uniref:Fibrinogen C-terminal domain-containing protein n=1 Tax=Macrostomum lignano TaxID=282301 RepID=A0A1I8FSH1_9PLAT